jgi:hypothetical protein
MVLALVIIEGDKVLIAWSALPQIQKTIRSIVAIGLTVPCTAKPPWGPIRSHPRLLLFVARVHGVGGASSATVLWAGNVDDPIWVAEWASGAEEGLPILPTCRCKKLRASRAAAFIQGTPDIIAFLALHEGAWRVVAIKRCTDALARCGAAPPRSRSNFLDALAFLRRLALRQGRERCKLRLLVRTCRGVECRYSTLDKRRWLCILDG